MAETMWWHFEVRGWVCDRHSEQSLVVIGMVQTTGHSLFFLPGFRRLSVVGHSVDTAGPRAWPKGPCPMSPAAEWA